MKLKKKIIPQTGMLIKCPKTGKVGSAEFCIKYCAEKKCSLVCKFDDL